MSMNNSTIISDDNWEEMIETVTNQIDFSDEQIEKGAIDEINHKSQDDMTLAEYLNIAKDFAESWAK